MPVDWGTKAAFDLFYRDLGERWGHPNTRPGIKLHYNWYTVQQWQASKFALLLFAVLELVSGDSVVLVGAGFNGTGAGLEALGVDVIAIDTSAYIQAQKGETEEAEIRAIIVGVGLDPDVDLIIGEPGNVMVDPLDVLLEGGRANPKARGKGTILEEDMGKRSSRNTIKNALASSPRYAITEEVLNSIPDAEALQVCEFAAKFAAETGCTIIHMLSPLLAKGPGHPDLNWKTYAGWRTFLDANGFSAQLILPTVTSWDQGETPLSADLPDKPNMVVAYSGTF